MKKSFLILAAVAGLFASCSNEVLVDNQQQALNGDAMPKAISFSTFAQLATRSAADYELEEYHQTFVVYGTKTDDNDATVQAVFGTNAAGANTGVTCDYIAVAADRDATQAWHYTPARYWDTQSQYYFAAYTPATAPMTYTFANDGDEVGATGTKFVTTSNYVIKGQNRMQDEGVQRSEIKTGFDGIKGLKDIDMMVSDLNSQHGKTHDANVDLIFRHTLAKLNVALDVERGVPNLGASGYKVLVKSVTVADLNSTGSFTSTLSGTKYEPKWTVVGADKVTYKFTDATGVELDTSDKYFIESLILPQDIAASQIVTLNYQVISIDDLGNEYTENFTYTLKLSDAFTGYTTYDEDTNYTIKFHINPENNVIVFDAGVAEWSTNVTGSKTIE